MPSAPVDPYSGAVALDASPMLQALLASSRSRCAAAVIAHALTSLALTELHPPRRYPFPAPKARRCDCAACDASGVDATDYAADPLGGVE